MAKIDERKYIKMSDVIKISANLSKLLSSMVQYNCLIHQYILFLYKISKTTEFSFPPLINRRVRLNAIPNDFQYSYERVKNGTTKSLLKFYERVNISLF